MLVTIDVADRKLLSALQPHLLWIFLI